MSKEDKLKSRQKDIQAIVRYFNLLEKIRVRVEATKPAKCIIESISGVE